MIYKMTLFCFAFLSNISFMQAQIPDRYYENAYKELDLMLMNKNILDFKKAVFIIENAYFDNQLDQEAFDNYIRFCTSICRGIIASGNIIYPEQDVERATAQCAVFLFMTDSIPIQTDKGIITHKPFEYNFDDFAGQKDWPNMFVSTLM